MSRMTSFTFGRCTTAEFSTKPSLVSPESPSRSSFLISPRPLRGRITPFLRWKSPSSGRSTSESRWPSVATVRRTPAEASKKTPLRL